MVIGDLCVLFSYIINIVVYYGLGVNMDKVYFQIELTKQEDNALEVKVIADPIKLNAFGFNTGKFGSLCAHIDYIIKRIYMREE